MASVILSSAGRVLGNAILPGMGGVLGGLAGRVAGNVIDNAVGLGAQTSGPRLDNLQVQDSRYGAGIPCIYGNVRIAGNVIWSSNLIETTQTTVTGRGGGKGGAVSGSGTRTTFTYSVHCAVAIGTGQLSSISTIWADNKIIYQNGVWVAGIVDSASFYLGTSTQNPDPFMQSILGNNNVPAYRGIAYIVLHSLQLSNFGNRLPNISFQVVGSVPAASAPTIIANSTTNFYASANDTTTLSSPPLITKGAAMAPNRILVFGYTIPGVRSWLLNLIEYDVTDTQPVEVARYIAPSNGAGNVSYHSSAVSPDGNTAVYHINGSGAAQYFILFDMTRKIFGNFFTLAKTSFTNPVQVSWLDNQRIIIDDVDTTTNTRGVHIYTRSGMNIMDVGFFGVWGAGTSISRQPLPNSEFIPFDNGVIQIMGEMVSGNVAGIWGCALSWQNGTLAFGTPYLISRNSLILEGELSRTTNFQIAHNEWVFFFYTRTNYTLFSCILGGIASSITRTPQKITYPFSLCSNSSGVFLGDRLVFIQSDYYASRIVFSEVLVGASSFTLATNSVAVTQSPNNLPSGMGGVVLDQNRILLINSANDSRVNLSVLQRGVSSSTVGAVLADILLRAGYKPADYDLSALNNTPIQGFVISEPMSAKDVIKPLQVFCPFDLIESGTVLKAVLRNAPAPVSVLPSERRASLEGKSFAPPYTATQSQIRDLPLEINIDYIDPSRNFEINSARARRSHNESQMIQKISLPVVCTPSNAKKIAETALFTSWAERVGIEISLSRAYLAIEPGDVLRLDANFLIRILSVQQVGGLLNIRGVTVYTPALSSLALSDGSSYSGTKSLESVPSCLHILDLPALRSLDDRPGVYMAVSGRTGWVGAAVWRANSLGDYTSVATFSTPAVVGTAVSALAAASPYTLDRFNSLTIQLGQGTLSSCAISDMLAGANTALLGKEIIQFSNAVLVAPGLYTLSNLVRGYRASEEDVSDHAVGETFILLDPDTLQFIPTSITDRNQTFKFRAVSAGRSLGSAMEYVFTYSMRCLCPIAPTHIKALRANGALGDLSLSWVRRSRLNGEWMDYVEVPMDQPSELYDIEIMKDNQVVRTFRDISGNTLTYTASMQMSDFGFVPSSVTVNIYQLSPIYGRGDKATELV